ncbi:DUF5309 family protein [Streptosporangium sp. NPDC001559]|uniref:SU10 major capsid protein n=1 Tax=Streptosporangium sp. NPDC001559 TaxID=3366187 RepID=UPI0036E981A8
MAGITGQGTTFNLPNFVGELFAATPTDTPFLSAIGGLTGGEAVHATLFPWSGYDLRDPDETRQRVEGANAPTGEARARYTEHNVLEIHQETLEISYTKLAATGQYNSTGSNNPGAVGVAGSNPVMNEWDWQLARHMEQIARDVERSFIVGTFNNPGDNSTARRTRGIMEATDVNVSTQGTSIGTAVIEADDEKATIAAHGLNNGDVVSLTSLTGGAVGVVKENQHYFVVNKDTNTFQLAKSAGGTAIAFATDGGAVVRKVTPLTEDIVLSHMQTVWENGGIQVSETATLMCNALLKRGLTELFITRKNYQEQTRSVGGVSLTTFETDFGRLNIMLNRHMPSSALQIVSLEECAPQFLTIPGKGHFFVEPLSKSGSAEKSQIYGEIGLKYGNKRKHGKVLHVGYPAPVA